MIPPSPFAPLPAWPLPCAWLACNAAATWHVLWTSSAGVDVVCSSHMDHIARGVQFAQHHQLSSACRSAAQVWGVVSCVEGAQDEGIPSGSDVAVAGQTVGLGALPVVRRRTAASRPMDDGSEEIYRPGASEVG